MRHYFCRCFLRPAALFATDHADRTVGSPNAPVTLEVWSDFQCPHCAQLHFGAMKEAMARLRGIGQSPHRISRLYSAADALFPQSRAVCRRRRRIGRYERVCDTLFRTQQEWGRTGDVDGAVAKELTPAEMAQGAQDPGGSENPGGDQWRDRIRYGAGSARSLCESTPTMILSGNGKRYPHHRRRPLRSAAAIDRLLMVKVNAPRSADLRPAGAGGGVSVGRDTPNCATRG